MNKAFTLVELLVVVLIIGILTAVALPQYQTAVQKSWYATLMPLAKSVKNAEEAILMANGSYSSKLADLSISLPGTADGDSKVTSSEGNSFTVTADDNQSYVRALTKDNKNAYVMYFDKSSRYPREIHCEAETDNKIAMQVCQSYGATQTVTGTTSGYTAYVIEGSGTDAGAISSGSNVPWGSDHAAGWEFPMDEFGDYAGYGELYDEEGRLIAHVFDCYTGVLSECSGEGDVYSYDGNRQTYRRCEIGEPVAADGTCSNYMSSLWSESILDPDTGYITTLERTTDADNEDGYYSNAWVYGSAGYSPTGEEVRFEANCSTFDRDGCSSYSNIYEEYSTDDGMAYSRLCNEISGTTCLSWDDWSEW